MNTPAFISIVIPNWNGRKLLEICLPSLQKLNYPHYEVIVVDNGSVDDSVDFVLKNFPEVKVVSLSTNTGFTGAVNAGIKASLGQYIALLNNDTEADPNWLSEAINAFENYPDVGFIACLMIDFWQRDVINGAGDMYVSSGNAFKRGFGRKLSPFFLEQRDVFGACGGAAIYRKRLFDEIGLFDIDYFAFLEDVDWSFRAQLAGYRCLYVPTSIIYHMEGVTAAEADVDHLKKYENPLQLETPKKTFWITRNKLYTLIKNLPLPLFFRYFFSIFFDGIITSGGFHFLKTGYGWHFVRGVFAVIPNLPRMLLKRWRIQKKRRASVARITELIEMGEDERRTMLLLHGSEPSHLPDNPKVSLIIFGDSDQVETPDLENQSYQNIDVIKINALSKLKNLSDLGDFVVTIRAGVDVPQNWVEELILVAKFDDRIGMIGSRIVQNDMEIIGWNISKGGNTRLNIQVSQPLDTYPEIIPIFAPCKDAALYRRSLLEQLGGFDELFGDVLDEVDLAFRARLVGWEALLAPRAVVSTNSSIDLSLSPSPHRLMLLLKNWTILMWARYFPHIIWENGISLFQIFNLRQKWADIFQQRRQIQRMRTQPLVLIKRWFRL